MRTAHGIAACLSIFLAATALVSGPSEAIAGHSRSDKEKAVRERFEWVVFGGEYHPWQLVPIGLDAAFTSGGLLSEEFAKNEAKKLGIDFAARLVSESKKSPIASGIMSFTMWESPFGQRINLGDKYVPYIGVLKRDSKPEASPHIEVPAPNGYSEFRRRMDEATSGKAELPALRDSIESQWLKYICNHCVGNSNTRDGYLEFRRRLDVAYQYRYAPGEFDKNYRGKPNLDLETIPPAFPADSKVGASLKEFVAHCVGNPDGEKGYQEFHRRIHDEVYPRAAKNLAGVDSAESAWTMYLMWHLVGNVPVIEK